MGNRSRSRSRSHHHGGHSHRHHSRSRDDRRTRERSRRHKSRSSSRSPSRHAEEAKKKSNFDQKPEGIPEEMLKTSGTIGAMMKSAVVQPNLQAKYVKRLLVTNLPKEYQDFKLKEFLTDVINKCADQQVPQPAILSLVAFKDQCQALVEFQNPELATASLALNGIPFEGVSIGVVRPPDFNPDDVPLPVGRPLRLHMEKVGYKTKQGEAAVAEALAANESAESKGKIFVGNIPTVIGDEQLKTVFQPFGEILSATITQDPKTNESKGYGYIIYKDPSILPVVCEKMNGLKLMDQSIEVRPATVSRSNVLLAADAGVELDLSIASTVTLDLPDLKTPIIADSNKARDAAAKLLKQAGLSTGGHIQKSPPSRILVLKNMVTKEDLENAEDYLDIKNDIESECARFGQVLSVVIPRGDDPGIGNVIIEYPNIQQAASAVVALIGRRFNKHIIRAAFMSEAAYANKEYKVWCVSSKIWINKQQPTKHYIISLSFK